MWWAGVRWIRFPQLLAPRCVHNCWFLPTQPPPENKWWKKKIHLYTLKNIPNLGLTHTLFVRNHNYPNFSKNSKLLISFTFIYLFIAGSDSPWSDWGLRMLVKGSTVNSLCQPWDLNWQPSDHGKRVLTCRATHCPKQNIHRSLPHQSISQPLNHPLPSYSLSCDCPTPAPSSARCPHLITYPFIHRLPWGECSVVLHSAASTAHCTWYLLPRRSWAHGEGRTAPSTPVIDAGMFAFCWSALLRVPFRFSVSPSVLLGLNQQWPLKNKQLPF